MSMPQVGSGAFAVVPTFRGFRSAVNAEAEGSTKGASSIFSSGFRKAGSEAGKGFSSSFKTTTADLSVPALKTATAEVTKSSRELSAARLKEQDAAGKTRVAEAALADARKRYELGSVQVIRAEERLATAQRGLVTSQSAVESSTEKLTRAKRDLATASDQAGEGARRSGNAFSGFFRTIGGESAGSFGTSFKSELGTIFAGNFLADIAQSAFRVVGQGISSGISFGLEGINLASDLKESLNATDVAFGAEISEQLRILGSDAPTRLALSRRAFAQFSTQFSSFAKTIRGNDVTGFIDELTNRGADFASVYNLEVGDALQLFQSGLAGETEPLRKFGIDLSAASVEAFAYASGIGTVGVELTEAEKQQARYALLLEQTNNVTGDNAATAGELAGQQRRLAVAYEESQAKLGEFLLPGWLAVVDYANTNLLPALGEVIDQVGPILGDALTNAGPKFEELTEKIKPLVEQFVTSVAEDGIPAFIDLMDDVVTEAPKWIKGFQDADQAVMDFTDDFFGAAKGINDLFKAKDWDEFVSRYKNWFDEVHGTNVTGNDALRTEAEETRRSVGGSFAAMSEEVGASLTTSKDISIDIFRRTGVDGVAAVNESLPGAAAAGQGLGASVGQGLTSAKPQVAAGARSAAEGLPTIVGESRSGMFGAGSELAAGLAEGIRGGKFMSNAAAKEIADDAVSTLRSNLKIQSPSKVAEEMGSYFTEGFAGGITKNLSQVSRATGKIRDAASISAQMSLSTVGGVGVAGTAAAPAIYVQNPFTGEYLLAQVGTVAETRIAANDRRNNAAEGAGWRN